MCKIIILGIAILLIHHSAFGLETITGKVTVLEPSYLPNSVVFQMDTGNSSCPVGTWLRWQKPDPESNKSVYSALLAALASGMKINFVIDNGDTTCNGQYIHLLGN